MKINVKAIIIASIIILSIVLSVLLIALRFVFLLPSFYLDNDFLTEEENQLIKTLVFESVKDRLSLFANTDKSIYDGSATEIEIIQLDTEQRGRKHIFVWIDSDFMRSVEKNENGYTVIVKTHGMERNFYDCSYEIKINKNFKISGFALNP